MVNDNLQNTGRILHDLGLATWFGGQVFGKFALNPTVAVIQDPAERGKVANSGWFTFNPFGVAGLGLAALVRLGARATELNPARQSETERKLSKAQDALMLTSLVLTVGAGVQGARLAAQAPDGAVPIESGTKPGPQTPPKAASLQRSIGALGNGAILAGAGLLSMQALQDRLAYSRPPLRRGLLRSSRRA